jgi:hypothetical protein
MTKKRFRKLARAYFTRLNEWAKENNSSPMNMGQTYLAISKFDAPADMTRAEWWDRISSSANTFGVGIKVK